MTVSELDKFVKNPNGIVLFYGDNTYLLEQYVKKIKKNFGECIQGINYVVVDEDNVNSIISDISTPAFGFEKKLIILKKCNLLKKEAKTKNKNLSIKNKLNNYIKEHINQIKESTIVVIIEDNVDKTELFSTIEKYGCVYNFQELKLSDLIKNIVNIFSMYNIKISNENAKYIVELVGTDMQDIINEIWKLVSYKNNTGEVVKEEIDLIVTRKVEAVIFDLTDNLGNKNIAKAIDVLNGLLYNKEPIQKILITLYNHFKRLYIYKLSEKYNMNALECLNLKPNQTFLVSKYKKQSAYFNEKELDNILKEFRDLDYKYKIGLIDLNIGLESILCKYCS